MIHPYVGKKAAFATMHQKEEIAAPLFADLGVTLLVPERISTDHFGTFDGETERKHPPLETARLKARLGMKLLGLPYGLASEGSFGPCRYFPFIGENCEILLWVDDLLGIEIHEQVYSTATNFSSAEVSTIESAQCFLNQARFPSHAVIVSPNQHSDPVYFKGIFKEEELEEAILSCAALSEDGLAKIQTDMRACHNPMRQDVIREAGKRLVKRIASQCSCCGCPGWGPDKTLRGLPCEQCRLPTSAVKEVIFSCRACSFSQKEERPDGKKAAEAKFCEWCNP